MLKSLLAAGLIVMQLLSTGAAPLYLCLDSDGSVGIDFGPSGCVCCHDEHDDAPATPRLASDTGELAARQHAPCDCAHIQISPAAGPVIASPMVDIRPHCFLAIFGSPAGMASAVWQLAGDLWQFFALAPVHSSIVLRC